MENNEKIALFDFCETLANFQTADAFVKYVQSHSPTTNKGIRFLYNVLNKSRVLGVVRRLYPKSSIDKRFILKQLKGRSQEELTRMAEDYYMNKVRTNLIVPVVEEMKRLKADGYRIYIISAGYDIYLQFFAKEFEVDGITATKVGFKDGKCTGCFDGPDCMFENKIDYIKQLVPETNYCDWFAFSDSQTDLPMLELVGHPIVVSKNNKSQKWAEKRGMKQFFWNK